MAKANTPKGIRKPQHSTNSVNKSWFLGIGINNYVKFPPLNNAVKDVKDVFILLLERYDIDEDNVVLLFDKEATRDNIIKAFDDLVENAKIGDKLLIYFSGHGHLDKRRNRGFWVPYDAEYKNTSHYIANTTILDYLEDINSTHILLISDSCFSGTLFMKGSFKSASLIEELESRKSRWALCSGRHDKAVYDGEPGTNSPFAQGLLKALEESPSDKLQISKLVDIVMELTYNQYEGQLPEGNPLLHVGHEGGQYVFCRKTDDSLQSSVNSMTDTTPGAMSWQISVQGKNISKDFKAWQIALASNRIPVLRDYLMRFPDGLYRDRAEKKIEELKHEKILKILREEAEHERVKASMSNLKSWPEKTEPRPEKSKSKGSFFGMTIQRVRKFLNIAISFAIAAFVWYAIRKTDTQITPDELIPPAGQNLTIRDLDGNEYNLKIIGNLFWLGENLRQKVNDSWCYDEKDDNCEKFGRLYKWESAQKGCSALGEGWRVPNDKDWMQLANYFGGYYDWLQKRSYGNAKAAYDALIAGGISELDLLLGGFRTASGRFEKIDSSGIYWSSTKNPEKQTEAWRYGIGIAYKDVRRGPNSTIRAYSCRCVKTLE